MNTKRQQKNTRRPRKVSALGKGGLKTKMNAISAKRVSLYPGFLMNGVASGTMKKPRGSNSSGKPEDNVLTENLQVFLDQNSVHSQRIINERSTVEEYKPSMPKPIGQMRCLRSSTKSLQPVVEKHSKSVFKKISNKMFITPVEPGTNNNSNFIKQTGYLTEKEECSNNEMEIVSSPQLVEHICSREHLKTFTQKMQVLFKTNYFPEKSIENVAAEILKQNLIVEGNLLKEEISVEEDKAEDQDSDEDIEINFVPVPSRRWVYNTPKNQKIKKRKVEQCQLKPALLLDNKIIKPILSYNGAYNEGFIGKVTEQRPSNMGFFEKELPFQSEVNQRSHPMPTYLESPAATENDLTFVGEGHNLTTQLRLPSKSHKRQESCRDDYKGEKNMFDFHSKPKKIFDF
ncbi:unnamed protein product [Ceutorhynchus assimilis]|uniref:Uncharacterized protein n=1 Tax=Ceutorhynchus assimilis TaxID=467358 RepID=A0A9N9MSN4_9CUCU|nr:unnamed protein product [Ceutorhynchus assimilis]